MDGQAGCLSRNGWGDMYGLETVDFLIVGNELRQSWMGNSTTEDLNIQNRGDQLLAVQESHKH